MSRQVCDVKGSVMGLRLQLVCCALHIFLSWISEILELSEIGGSDNV
jgi:hypothetical protein